MNICTISMKCIKAAKDCKNGVHEQHCNYKCILLLLCAQDVTLSLLQKNTWTGSVHKQNSSIIYSRWANKLRILLAAGILVVAVNPFFIPLKFASEN